MEIRPFQFAQTPRVLFGPGAIERLPDLISVRSAAVLLVTGGASLMKSGRLDLLRKKIAGIPLDCRQVSVKGEPTPELIDAAVAQLHRENIGLVIAIGGGSVLDAGKAISAMLPLNEPVAGYLEGVGTKKHSGVKIPFIAVPTTAGTGSEATKNAVISTIGAGGFKRSLRHDRFVPDIAVIDPGLALTCPPDISASCGMDAFTQLLESFVSSGASALTDALARDGLAAVASGLVPSCTTGAEDIAARSAMAYAAYLSGVTLANAGLGVVHGLASSIGARFDIPHGVICGTLMGAAVRMNIRKLRGARGDGTALRKYARAGSLLRGVPETDEIRACDALADMIDDTTDRLLIPRLGKFGVTAEDIPSILSDADNKNNPVKLTPDEIGDIVRGRI